jgi:hypothetical protein
MCTPPVGVLCAATQFQMNLFVETAISETLRSPRGVAPHMVIS